MKKKRNRGVYRNLALISQVGLNVITPILVGVFIGNFLDKHFKTKMVFTLTLIIIGALAGFLNLFKLAGKKPREDKEDE